jgi:AcrR family transcriptional regulator
MTSDEDKGITYMDVISPNKQRKTPDRRTVKTKKALIDALSILLRDREISAITVSKLVEIADVNRKTFYTHYYSVDDVLKELENETAKKFAEVCESLDFSIGGYGLYPMMKNMAQMLSDDKEFYRYVFRSPGYSHIVLHAKKLLKEKLISEATEYYSIDQTMLECAAEFISAGTISTLQQWFDSEDPLTVETLVLTMSDFISAGMGLLLSSYK